MSKKQRSFSRREFLKTASAVGIGSILSPAESLAVAEGQSDPIKSESIAVPTRPFGRTGTTVACLGLGGAFHWSNLLLMKQALNLGVTYWDTAPRYGNGQSEIAIGKYFQKFPEDRKKVFLVTKSDTFHPPSMKTSLKISLEKMNTAYIDLFLLHGIASQYDMDQEIKAWAEEAKSQGKIRLFGFSTHQNMEDCLLAAAKMGWIDGIMFTYNFRIMHTENMKKAVEDCFKAGIGLTAMKTQATGWATSKDPLNETEKNLLNQFQKKGLTMEQGKLKAVWDDNRIASICAHMTNMKVLSDNASTAMDSKMLSNRDKRILDQYARETASNYCAGCADICGPTINNEVPVSDIIRFLMYERCYGEPGRAKSAFTKMPGAVRRRMTVLDYKEAERKCPQGLPISRCMREAAVELA